VLSFKVAANIGNNTQSGTQSPCQLRFFKNFILSLLTITACSTVQAADVSQQQAIKQHWGQGGEPGKPYNNLTPMVKDGDKEIHGLTID